MGTTITKSYIERAKFKTNQASTLQYEQAAQAPHLLRLPFLTALFTICLICVALVTSKPALAQNQASHQAALLMTLSDLNRQMDSLSGILINALQDSGRQTVAIPASLIASLTEAVQVSFAADKLKNNLLQGLDNGLTPAEMETLLQWYDSDLGHKIVRFEAKASSPEGIQEMLSQAAQLIANKRLPPYTAQIDEIVGATEFTMRLQHLTQRAIFQAASQGLNPQNPVDISLFDKQWAAQKQQIQAANQQLATLTFNYNYQHLSNEELTRYIRFLSSPEAIKFNSLATKTIEQLFITATEEMLSYVSTKPSRDPLAY